LLLGVRTADRVDPVSCRGDTFLWILCMCAKDVARDVLRREEEERICVMDLQTGQDSDSSLRDSARPTAVFPSTH